jgi:hypothetical protein
LQTVVPLTKENDKQPTKSFQNKKAMKKIFTLIAACALNILWCNTAHAQTNFYIEMQRSAGNATFFEVKLKMCMADASTTNAVPHRLGNAVLSFEFNSGVIGNPVLVSSPLNNSGKYFCNLVNISNKKASFNIIQDFSTYQNGAVIATSNNFTGCTELATLRFDVYNPNGNVNLKWNYDGSINETNVAVDDAVFGIVPQTQIFAGTPASAYLHGMVGASPLPVTLTNFDGEKDDKRGIMTLNWTTATEINSAWFEVQHSTDQTNWANIDEMTAAGNSNEIKNYTIEHRTPKVGINYYRLKMIDADGTYEYSKTIAMELKAGKPVLQIIYPMPVQTMLNLRYTTADFQRAELAIYDTQARLVMTKDLTHIASANEVQVNVEGLSTGTYLVKLRLDNHLLNGRFIKQ